jgi:hypothetical protein
MDNDKFVEERAECQAELSIARRHGRYSVCKNKAKYIFGGERRCGRHTPRWARELQDAEKRKAEGMTK